MLVALRHRELAAEAGQATVMMLIAMTLVFLIGVIVVDFGFWFNGRESVVNALDSASLSASLKLPNDGAGAVDDALEYVADNDPDIDPGDVEVEFRCIVGDRNNNNQPDANDIAAICPQNSASSFTCDDGLCYAVCTYAAANAKCNTIVVAGSKDIEFAWGDQFGLTGAEAAGFTSAACRGACGEAPVLPLDVVMIIDRSGSMCTSGSNCPDLDNAKIAAKSVLTLFDPDIQHVALGVLGQSSTTSFCTGANSGAMGLQVDTGGTWMPVGLANDYLNSDGTLNTSSMLVKTINCLQGRGATDLGSPLKAAVDYLNSNGRSGVKKGIILFTDGAANQPVLIDTGNLNCTLNAAVTTNAGDNNGYELLPGNACAQDNVVASDLLTGTVSGNTTCTATSHDKHDFWGYGATLPVGSPVNGIEVVVRANVNSTAASTRRICVQLSWDNGVSWGTAVQTGSNLSTSLANYTFSSSTNWGHTFLDTELPNLRVRVTSLSNNTTTNFLLDWVSVRAFSGQAAGRGPCDWAVQQSDYAKSSEIELFTIGYGISGAFCEAESGSSPYENEQATKLLAGMATQVTEDDGGDGFGGLPEFCPPTNQAAIDSENSDNDHFLCEARGNQLEPVFRAAAEALISSSKLVKIPF